MRRILGFVLGLTLAVGIALGMIGTQALHAQYTQAPQPIKRTVLLKTDLQGSGLEGYEAYLVMVDVAPRALNPKHYHPGAVIAYTLSGESMWQPVGAAAKTLTAGSGVYIQAKQVHEEVGGPSGAKQIAVFIVPKGSPLTVPVK